MRKDEEKKWKQERIEKEIKKETQKETDTKVHIHNENRNEQNWSHIKIEIGKLCLLHQAIQ